MKKCNWVQSILTVLIFLVVPIVGSASALGFSLEAGLDYRQLMPDKPAIDGLFVSPQDAVADDQNILVETLILNEGSCLPCSSADYLKTDRATFYGYHARIGNLPYEVGWQKAIAA